MSSFFFFVCLFCFVLYVCQTYGTITSLPGIDYLMSICDHPFKSFMMITGHVDMDSK